MNESNGIKVFFKVQAIAVIIACIRADIKGRTMLEILDQVYFIFMYSFMISIWAGLASMFAVDFYHFIKKNLRVYDAQFQLY